MIIIKALLLTLSAGAIAGTLLTVGFVLFLIISAILTSATVFRLGKFIRRSGL